MTASTPYQNARLLIDGEWIESQTTQWQDIVNPATQQVLAKVPFATAAEVNAAIEAAQRAFQTWKLTPIGARMRIMLKLQALIREHSKRIAVVLSAEQGKTIADAEGDIFPWPGSGRARVLHRHPANGRVRRERRRWRRHLHPAPTHRRLRRHHAVQLPGDDPAVDVPDGHRLR
jgi:hypothetical protein